MVCPSRTLPWPPSRRSRLCSGGSAPLLWKVLGIAAPDIPALVAVAMLNGNPDNPVDVDADSFTLLFQRALTVE